MKLGCCFLILSYQEIYHSLCYLKILSYCNNRTVFSKDDLKGFWLGHRYNLSVLKFVFVKSLTKKINLEFLWNNGIIVAPNGPRPFTKITDEQFEMIMSESNTEKIMIGE